MFRIYTNTDGLKVVLPETIFDEIKSCIEKFYPNECGGIFVGKINNDYSAIIEKMMVPKKFRSTPVYFLRVADLLNQWLEKVFQRDGGETIYLGEWHSHPNGAPIPSSTDVNAMKAISNNDDVRISTPLLLIVGYNGKSYDEKFYIYSNSQLKQYKNEQ